MKRLILEKEKKLDGIVLKEKKKYDSDINFFLLVLFFLRGFLLWRPRKKEKYEEEIHSTTNNILERGYLNEVMVSERTRHTDISSTPIAVDVGLTLLHRKLVQTLQIARNTSCCNRPPGGRGISYNRLPRAYMELQ